MSKKNKARNRVKVPTLAEVAPTSTSQRLSEDLVAASLARTGTAQSAASNQGVAFEQVRELLMGETIQSLRDDLNTSHRIILQRVDALGTSASSQLETLEEKVACLSTGVAAEVFTRKAFADTHQQSMQTSASELEQELGEMKQSADSSMAKLAEDFGQQASFQAKAIENFAQTMSSQLAEKGQNLNESTIAKDRLATILSDAAKVLADPEPATVSA